jgi:hypothetical protein
MTLRTTVAARCLVTIGTIGERAGTGGGSALTSEQWQQRVLEARRRSEEFVANARTQTADPPSSEKEDAEAADRRL